jgi:hypothetical protein
MTRAALLALVVLLVPASAGTSAPLALTAAPARVLLIGTESAEVRVRNTGTQRVTVDVRLAGYTVDLRGRPHIVRRGARSAAAWLRLRPARLTLGPHATGRVHVSARVPRHAAPGDHDALVLLSSRPLADGRVSVRVRLGVVAVVRAPGPVVRRLHLGRLRVRRRVLELVVMNSGNVSERLLHVHATFSRSGRRIATVGAGARELRPHTRGLLEFRLRPSPSGLVTVRVVVSAEPGRPTLRRTYRIRL